MVIFVHYLLQSHFVRMMFLMEIVILSVLMMRKLLKIPDLLLFEPE